MTLRSTYKFPISSFQAVEISELLPIGIEGFRVSLPLRNSRGKCSPSLWAHNEKFPARRGFAVTQMIATNASLWDEAWQLAWTLDRKGFTLPLQDVVIACCAKRAGAAVMTRDKHFRQIPDLRVIDL